MIATAGAAVMADAQQSSSYKLEALADFIYMQVHELMDGSIGLKSVVEVCSMGI
jgi:hypothetical protein